jgi:hypothetical protein
LKRDKRYAIRYSNKMFHCWDSIGDYDYVSNVDEAHFALSLRAAEEIANLIWKDTKRRCEVVEVESGYLFIEHVGKRSR